jgi:long-chain acyl-CoA synthetase
MLSHKGFVGVATGMNQAQSAVMKPGLIVASILPMGHIYPSVVLLACLLGGASTGLYHGDPLALVDDLQAMKPHVLPGVPRVYETIYTRAVQKFQEKDCIRQQYVKHALATQTELHRLGKPRDQAKDRRVFAKIQETVGGQLKYATSGASKLLPALQEWVKVALNVEMIEGYGLTESFGVAIVQETTWGTIGNVGAPINSIEVRLQDVPDFGYLSTQNPPQGELCLRGVNIMTGYYKDEKKTAGTIKDGWLHTGDIARRNEDGTFSIIDRIANIFKLGATVGGVEGAIMIAPEEIESQLNSCEMVNQAWIFGSPNYPHLVAVIVLDADKLFKRAGLAIKAKVDDGWQKAFAELCEKPETTEWVMKDIEALVNQKKITLLQKPKHIHLEGKVDDLGLGFTVQNTLLTPTFKLRRGFCKEQYKEELKEMYERDNVQWKA